MKYGRWDLLSLHAPIAVRQTLNRYHSPYASGGAGMMCSTSGRGAFARRPDLLLCCARTLRRRLVGDQIAVVVDREPGLARFRHHRGMPVDFAGVGTADNRHQQRLGAAGEIANTAI